MSLEYHYYNRGQLYEAGFGFRAKYLPNGEGFSGMVAYNDLFSRYLAEQFFYCPTDPRTASEIIGFKRPGGLGPEIKQVSFAPERYKYDDRYDDHLYGSLYKNLQVFGATLSGRSFSHPSHSRENACKHSTYSGVLTVEQVRLPTEPTYFWFVDREIVVSQYRDAIWGVATVNSVDPLVVTPSTWYLGQPCINILYILNDIVGKEMYNIEVQPGGYYVEHFVTNVTYVLTHERLVIKYHQHTHGITAGGLFDWDGEIVVPFVDSDPTIDAYVGGSWYNVPTAATIYRFSNGKFSDTTWEGYTSSRMSDEFVSQSQNPVFPFFMSDVPAIYDPVDQRDKVERTLTQLSDGRFLKPFRYEIERNYADITTTSLFSSVAAFKEAEGYLGVNVLQNLAKIPSISSAIPQIREAVSILGHLANRDLSLSTMKEILDLASSTVLQASFQWRPYIGLFTTYLPAMLATMHSLGDIHKNAVGYGSFRHTFSNEFGREEVTLLTRTKIVMESSPSKLLSAVLGIDALGLLPKASNLWDLVPFSFVANWFTGVGEAIRNAEYSLLLATVPAYYVHTYTISSPLSPDELTLLHASTSLARPASLRLYYRDVSLNSPMPRDSRFGFGIPSGLPPIGVIGALLYQLIF